MKLASGFYGANSRRHKLAKQKTFRAGVVATRDRRRRKRDFRRLWITRVSAACDQRGIQYSRLIDALNKADIVINRRRTQQLTIYN
jgi:large subunit ribosomal protein L20